MIDWAQSPARPQDALAAVNLDQPLLELSYRWLDGIKSGTGALTLLQLGQEIGLEAIKLVNLARTRVIEVSRLLNHHAFGLGTASGEL